VWKNPGGIGHVAMVRPGQVTSQGPAIAQAGSKNFNNGHVKDSFGNRPVQYWVNDSGKSTGSPSTPTPPAPTPTTPTPTPGGSTSVPQVDLRRGAEGPEVKQLQDALVRLGHMTAEQVATGPGTFGPKTEAALKAFQASRGITVDGVYGPQSRQAGTGGTDAAKAARLNDMLKNSGLRGQGEHILAMSRKYNVPPELALAMFWKEAQWNTTGVAPRNNNPGNLRFAEWERQFGGEPNGGFTKFPSVAQGIEAYFRLMNVGYRQFIDNKDWAGLINKYAPPSDGNNSSQYAQQIAQWMDTYRAQLNG
jgi:peptidoglycan hydrolase-like protein with peptidoglycan-binding domain